MQVLSEAMPDSGVAICPDVNTLIGIACTQKVRCQGSAMPRFYLSSHCSLNWLSSSLIPAKGMSECYTWYMDSPLGTITTVQNRIMEIKEPINVETNGFEVVSPLARVDHNNRQCNRKAR